MHDPVFGQQSCVRPLTHLATHAIRQLVNTRWTVEFDQPDCFCHLCAPNASFVSIAFKGKPSTLIVSFELTGTYNCDNDSRKLRILPCFILNKMKYNNTVDKNY